MSEIAFYVVPADPFLLPDDARCEAFLEFFKEVCPLPNANGEFAFKKYDRPALVDAGAAFEAVVCPSCGKRLELVGEGEWGEHYEWWQSVLKQPRDSTVKTPCCGTEIRVVDFKFDAPGAFARLSVGALEPSFSEHWEEQESYSRLTPEAVARFEEILGCGIVQIWQV